MATSVLLVNFAEKQADRLRKALPINFSLGFISDGIEGVDKRGERVLLPSLDVPPIYENAVAFINLSHIKGLEAAYAPSALDLRQMHNFHQYWSQRGGIIVYYLGDYSYRDLLPLGVDDVKLVVANKRDKVVEIIIAKESAHITEAFKKLKPTIKTPLSYYIEPTGKWREERYGKPEMRGVYCNLNGDILGVYVDNAKSYDREAAPSAIILPEFSDNVAATIEILKALAGDYPDLIPEIAEQDWATSDKLYPVEVGSVDNDIRQAIDDTRVKIDGLNAKKETLKETYGYLPLLLTATGSDLKQAVIKALRFLGVEAKDVDESNQGPLGEDVLIDMPGDDERKILAEVKGTRAKTPPDLYIGQVWKHIAQSDMRGVKTGALILNHDRMTEPHARPDAYSGSKEKELNDIIFIDTRELHRLLLMVIDQGLDKAAAAAQLFSTGRLRAQMPDSTSSPVTEEAATAPAEA